MTRGQALKYQIHPCTAWLDIERVRPRVLQQLWFGGWAEAQSPSIFRGKAEPQNELDLPHSPLHNVPVGSRHLAITVLSIDLLGLLGVSFSTRPGLLSLKRRWAGDGVFPRSALEGQQGRAPGNRTPVVQHVQVFRQHGGSRRPPR